MPAEKLYLETAAIEGTATVTGVVEGDRNVVRLDRTLFHLQGGGQLADTGLLSVPGQPPVKVLDVRHAKGGDVDHVVDDLKGGGWFIGFHAH